MLDRCTNEKSAQWGNYGGKGVKVCPEWDPKQGGSFTRFIQDMGQKPSELHTIDKDWNSNGMLYSPSTCRWATRKEQNQWRRNNHYLTFDGEIQCLTKWAEDFEMSRTCLQKRLLKGWSVEKALTTPVRFKRR